MQPSPRWLLALAHVGGYLAATAVWLVVLGIGVAVWLLGIGGSLTDGTTVAVLTIVQLAGMAAIGLAGAWLLPPRGELGQKLGMVRATWVGTALAGALGLVVGLFPSWLSEMLADWLPTPLVNQLIGQGLDGSLRSLLLTAAMVCAAAPICEEIVFRGYLWSAFEKSGAPPALTWLATSLLFTAYHLDPAQMFGVLPIALALGWARWRTGSLWPGMLLHFVNNALALAASASLVADWAPPAWLAALSLASTLGLCAALGLRGGRR